ncbi:MAG: SIS domain-containing protein [Candidatus Binatia bacterium]
MKTSIAAIFAESISVKERFLQENGDTLEKVIDLIARVFKAGQKLLLCGNGGSAADAQHIAAEFVNRYLIERPPLPALALTTDTSALTSITNDYGPEEIFAKQIQALGKAGDVMLAISTSGNSSNIVRALEVCRAYGIHTVGLTGGTGGKVAELVDYLLCVSATTVTPRIQETHILVGHVICEMIDHKLFATGCRSL